MEEEMRDAFVSLWRKYFGDAELPIAVFFSDVRPKGAAKATGSGPCIVNMLPRVRKGQTLSFSAESRICGGARRYLGFTAGVDMSNFEHFLSYGIPDKLEGERYKKSPELVRESAKYSPSFKAPKEFIVFKRWDKLSKSDEPEVIVFLAGLDVIAGLFTLANFDEAEPNAVICPFGSGCSSMVYHPYLELRSPRPRCVLGMFDISARPCVGENTLSFAIPLPKFQRMVDNMTESFLTKDSWKDLRKRSGSPG
ncbi:MAG: DUF169 domain-containing protein [Euryarchaeota archaeon]|nr:DUF169 domain-containing protein [Euryarchaeota archaeon]